MRGEYKCYGIQKAHSGDTCKSASCIADAAYHRFPFASCKGHPSRTSQKDAIYSSANKYQDFDGNNFNLVS
jgi:hypothetical protein